MIKFLAVRDFSAVPYLETSALMTAHPSGIEFSVAKPNVVVGPNGAGKSALMTALALLTLSYLTGESALDDGYTSHRNEKLWNDDGYSWAPHWKFLPGLTADTDRGPAMYFRPNHIPGNDHSVTAAMMCGYFEEARAYGRLTEKKSSGEKTRAVQEKILAVLQGLESIPGYRQSNWSFGLRTMRVKGNAMPWDHQAEVLKALYAKCPAEAKPVLLLDEPEQSLDAVAEAKLWGHIVNADAERVQVILATHSLYPFMHPEKFHIIEAVPGYVREVQALL